MDELIKFVPEQLYILVAGLYVIGIFFKNIPKVKDWTIPWLLTVLGIGFSIALNGFNATSILQGIVCTGVSVYGNQLFKQTVKKS